MPNNSFVLDFVHTYNYLKACGVGKNIVKTVRNPSVMVELIKDDEITEYEFDDINRLPLVHWESRKGAILSNGRRQSPAVRLEHEFDHAMDDLHDHKSIWTEETLLMINMIMRRNVESYKEVKQKLQENYVKG